jgi:hypothetical protein
MNPVSNTELAQSISNANDVPAKKPGDWKATLKSKLQTTLHDWHERAPGFEELINDYVSSGPVEGRECLKRLVSKCMALPEPEVLKEILRNEVVERLCLEGQFDARGWESLIAAMPAGFPVKALELSITRLDSSEVGLLLKALHGMPKLEKLCFYAIDVEGAVPSEWPEGLAFDALKAVEVTTSFEPETDVCVLLLRILEGCQVRSLSVQDNGAMTAVQHARLADALRRQLLLNSVSLIVAQPCSTPKQLDCYMPFLRGQAPFTALDLDGFELEISNFNLLLAALRNKPTLASFSLRNFKFLKGKESEPVQISALAGMPNLLDLDLGWNSLEDDTMRQLLLALKEQQTCLRFVGLNGNSIGSRTIAATAALLNANRTLLGLSLQRAVLAGPAGWSADALEALAEAFEANTSLQRFRVNWSDIPKACYQRLMDSVERNRRPFAANRMWAGLNSARPGFPKDVAVHIYEQGLTHADAVSMSSVDRAAWDARRR